MSDKQIQSQASGYRTSLEVSEGVSQEYLKMVGGFLSSLIDLGKAALAVLADRAKADQLRSEADRLRAEVQGEKSRRPPS